jgi:bacterioferritin-associated ferredoxin
MIICVCHRVSDRDIARAVREGCISFEQLQFDLGVATCCGKCQDSAREALKHHAVQVAASHGPSLQGGAPELRRLIPIAGQRPLSASVSVVT